MKQQITIGLTLTRQYNHVYVKTRKFLKQSGNDDDPDLNALTTTQTANANIRLWRRDILYLRLQNITNFSSPCDHSFLLINTSI